MPSRNVLPLHTFDHATLAGRRAAAGCWKLASGRALSLRPRQRSVLEIAHGRAWVTVGNGARRWHWPWPARSTSTRSTDVVLHAGERLAIDAGRHVVVEVWCMADPAAHATDALAFRWDVAPAAARADSVLERDAHAEWESAVRQPLQDLLHAVAQGGRAVGTAVADAAGATVRLVWGIARFTRHRMATPPQRRAA